MSMDYIKSYLIKLGVDINPVEISKWDQSLKSLDRSFSSTVKGLFSTYSKMSGLYAGLTTGIYKFASSVARSDLEVQKLANHMYMSKDSAKALQNSLDAMGLSTGDLQDIALSPELTSQYKELISLSQSLGTPKAVSDSLKSIRAISFEFSKLNTITNYFMERVTHFIYQVASGPANSFKKFMQDFNQRFAKNIDSWAKSLANIIGSILRISLRLGEALSTIISKVSSLWDRLSGLSKGVIGAVYLLNKIIKGSPIWRLITVFTGFLMLLDDYKTYKEGGISAKILKPVWKFVDEQRSDPDSGWNVFVNSISNLVTGLIDAINWLTDTIKNLVSKIESSALGKFFGLGDNRNWDYLGDSVGERARNKLDYIENVSFWDRFLSDISGGRWGTSSKEYLDNRLSGINNNLNNGLIPQVSNTQNYTPISNTQNYTPVNQTFNFNVNGVNNPNEFSNQVSTLIRNNKSRFVG